MPSLNQLHVDEALTQISIAYRNQAFVAEEVLPVVPVQKKNDVWVAGESNGRIDVVHFDGNDWIESYPFSGSAFGGFSHGPGARLFAFIGWDILELSSSGTWQPTDVSANAAFGAPADLWVAASGEAPL